MTARTFTARWVFPVAGPPLARGTVTVRGDRIESVDPSGARTPDEDLGNAAVIPGLVNAHTHLDLSGARGLVLPTDPEHFTDWLRGVIAYRRARTPEQVQDDIGAGLAESLRFGTTLIGDVAVGGASWPAVSSAAVRATLFWEIIGLDSRRCYSQYEEFILKVGMSWDDDAPAAVYPVTPLCRWAASPHAPYSVSHEYALGQLLVGNAAIHLAESPAELELLASRTGPFVRFLQDLGVWNPDELTAGLLDFLVSPFQTRTPKVYIHCNYLPSDAPFNGSQTVVYCPRTHAAFGHPPHPFPEFLKRGVRVALGTDSLASNPDLDLLAEARFVRRRYPDVPGDVVLRMATLAGAEALGWAAECGSLEPGKSADFVAVPLPDRDAADPHDLLLGPDAVDRPRRTLFRGAWRSPSS